MFLPVTILRESLRHKSNTFHTILAPALCTCLYQSHLGEPVAMKQSKHSRKSEAQNLCSKCEHMHSNDYAMCNRCRDDACGPAASTCSADFQLLNMDPRAVDPLLKDTPYAVIHRTQIWRIGWPHPGRDKLLASLSAAWWQCHVHCTVNGMISVTSTLRHQVRGVHGTQRSIAKLYTKNHKNPCIFVKVIVKKSAAPFLCGHGV